MSDKAYVCVVEWEMLVNMLIWSCDFTYSFPEDRKGRSGRRHVTANSFCILIAYSTLNSYGVPTYVSNEKLYVKLISS